MSAVFSKQISVLLFCIFILTPLLYALPGPESDLSDVYWNDQFPFPGANSTLYSMVSDSLGNLYIGGSFTAVGNAVANRIAKWNGSTWSALGEGLSGDGEVFVSAIALDSLGNLYAAGRFTIAGGVSANQVAMWDGISWHALGSGIPLGVDPYHSNIKVLAVDASNNLYAGGTFTNAGGISVSCIAKWDGMMWSALGTGMQYADYTPSVRTILFDKNGLLYAGGEFDIAGGIAADSIAMWDGMAWSPLGSKRQEVAGADTPDRYGIPHSGICSAAMDRFDNIYVWSYEYRHYEIGYCTFEHIDRWDGTSWCGIRGGEYEIGERVNFPSIAVDELGNLYLANLRSVEKWNGTDWSTLDGPYIDGVYFALDLDPSGKLYVGGGFYLEGDVNTNNIAMWNGSHWCGLETGMFRTIDALAVDAQSKVYAAGYFAGIPGTQWNTIASWNGVSWAPLDSGIGGERHTLAVDGSGNLYYGGEFSWIGEVSASRVAKWDGSAWSSLGSGIESSYTSLVAALSVDHSGNLYAGGTFNAAGETTCNNIAKWDGSSWSSLGAGVQGTSEVVVSAVAVDIGNNIYAGGDFAEAGGLPANHIAKWDGTDWSALGEGMDGAVKALAADGAGTLYAGGQFTVAGGTTVNHIAQWNGSSWTALGTGMNDDVLALAADASENLYAGGTFTEAGGALVNRIARWNGVEWSSLGTGMSIANYTEQYYYGPYESQVVSLVINHNSLFVGGEFINAGNVVSYSLAVWQPRVNQSQLSLTGTPESFSLGNDIFGFYKPTLHVTPCTYPSYEGGFPVSVRLDRAEAIEVGGIRVNGACTFSPAGIYFGGSGASLSIEFSEDDAAAYGVTYSDFVPAALTYPIDYPVNKEASSVIRIGNDSPMPVRIENGRQIYAITSTIYDLASTFGAVPVFFITGTSEGAEEGESEGPCELEGEMEGTVEGIMEGAVEGVIEGSDEGEGGGEGEGEICPIACITPCFTRIPSTSTYLFYEVVFSEYKEIGPEPCIFDQDGNGMLDMMQLALYDAVFTNVPLTTRCCIIEAWNNNEYVISSALDDFDWTIYPSVFRNYYEEFCTAFVTIGEPAVRDWFLSGVWCVYEEQRELLALLPSADVFDSSAAQYLATDGDADLDGVCNLAEYRATVTNPHEYSIFVEAALNPEITGNGGGCSAPCFESTPQYLMIDQNKDGIITLSDLLRVIQFFNSGGYRCQSDTEDGYAPGWGDIYTCFPLDSDYNPQDWSISLSELLRLIQFFNSGGYHSCEGSEDGFCPGL